MSQAVQRRYEVRYVAEASLSTCHFHPRGAAEGTERPDEVGTLIIKVSMVDEPAGSKCVRRATVRGFKGIFGYVSGTKDREACSCPRIEG